MFRKPSACSPKAIAFSSPAAFFSSRLLIHASTPHRRNLRDANHRTYAIEVGKYFQGSEGEVDEWLFKAAPWQAKQGLRKFKIPRFRRTLSYWLNLLLETGFQLERIEEPRPSDETIAACPELQDAQAVAYFLHLRVRKPQN